MAIGSDPETDEHDSPANTNSTNVTQEQWNLKIIALYANYKTQQETYIRRYQ